MSNSVLVVEDSLTVRMRIVEAFEAVGFRCLQAESLAAARRALHPGFAGLVILDRELPDGDAMELLKELKSGGDSQPTPIIVVTQIADIEDRIRVLNAGADDCVGKPFSTDYLVARAHELLGITALDAQPGDVNRILLIDDSLTVREELGKSLEAAGYEVILAASGEEGLKLAGMYRPTALIVDGNLPGIDGYSVIWRLRQDSALVRTPCLLLTGRSEDRDEIRALEAGADAFIAKSSSLDITLARLASLLRTGGSFKRSLRHTGLLGPKRILLVDDSLTYLTEMAGLLGEDGYHIVAASCGEEAISLVKIQPQHCILLDLQMPGLSGLETCKLIREMPGRERTPVLILTAREDPQCAVDAMNVGADDFVTKASDGEVIRARVRAVLRRRHHEEEELRVQERTHTTERELTRIREAASRELADARAELLGKLEQKNAALAAANVELDSFAHTVSHDLKAPVRHIIGFGEIAEEHAREKRDALGLDSIEKITNSARRLGGLIDSLLAFSKMGRGSIRRVKVLMEGLVREIIHGLEPDTKGREISFEVGELPEVFADPALLRQVLVNLLSNAIKYTRGRSPAVIRVTCAAPESGSVIVRVSDNGAGFDMKKFDRLFGIFQRLHRPEEFEGTGVGLATVRRIIARHGGSTGAQGEIGKGATFWFSLPCSITEGTACQLA